MLTSYPADRLHDKHPPPPASEPSRQPADQHSGGSILDADPPDQGVKIARRNTHFVPTGETTCRLEWLATRVLPLGPRLRWTARESTPAQLFRTYAGSLFCDRAIVLRFP